MAGPRVVAHRGASALYPENTMEAFAHAVACGADGLELDVHRSRDGEVIVLHDASVERTTDGHGRAAELDLRTLRSLDAGYNFRDGEGNFPFRGHGIRIPTLEELLRTFPAQWLSIDLKQGDPRTEERTIELLRAHGHAQRCILGAEDAQAAQRLRAMAPDIPSFFSRAEVREFVLRFSSHLWWGYRPPAQSLQIPARSGAIRMDRKGLVARAHEMGVRVMYWTINESAQMRRLLDLGADGLITDRPERLAAIASTPRAAMEGRA